MRSDYLPRAVAAPCSSCQKRQHYSCLDILFGRPCHSDPVRRLLYVCLWYGFWKCPFAGVCICPPYDIHCMDIIRRVRVKCGCRAKVSVICDDVSDFLFPLFRTPRYLHSGHGDESHQALDQFPSFSTPWVCACIFQFPLECW